MYLTDRCFKPLVQVLDNECLKILKSNFEQRNIEVQLVTPHLHGTNAT